MMPVWILTLGGEERNKLEILYNDYAKQMRAIAGQFLKKQEDIEDAVSDAFVKIANNMSKLENRSLRDVYAFCTVVAKNAARDINRDNIRHDSVFTKLKENIAASPLNIIECYEFQEIRKYILKLPEELKEVVWLYYYMGIPVKEIASIQYVKPITVYKRIERSQQLLLEMLEDDNNAD